MITEKVANSLYPIHHWVGSFILWDTIEEEGGIAPHEEKRQPLEEVSDFNLLVLALVPSKHCPKLLDLLGSHLVPPSQGIGCHRNEGETLLPAGFSHPSKLPVKGLGDSKAIGGS